MPNKPAAIMDGCNAKQRGPPPPLVQRLTAEERESLERRLVRRIDRRLLPLVTLMYILNYLDRNAIASARVQGLQEDLRLSDVQYQVGRFSLG